MTIFMFDMPPLEIRLLFEAFWLDSGTRIPIRIAGPLKGTKKPNELGEVKIFEAEIEYDDFLYDPRVFLATLHYKERKTQCIVTLMGNPISERMSEMRDGSVVCEENIFS